ncbi:MAG: alpha/beta fold hydrolase [Candidatus Rokubacteria bacterium]|nr:alpha/beta fold hydrolase [Candidatus Rokubacteria bacterium]
MQRPVAFYSAGAKLSGHVHGADGTRPGQRRPGIVVCTGFAAVQNIYLPEICEALAEAGYLALRFDYRGFGESEGVGGRVVPMDHVQDIRNAITVLQQQPEADPERIGLYGTSFGGAHVSYTAAVDERVACTVSTVGIGSGRRWMRSLRRYWEWRAFLRRLAEDRVRRVLTGTSSYVSPYEIMVRDPYTEAVHAERQRRFPGSVADIVLESGEAIIEFAPEDVVDRIAPRAILWIHSGNDELVPAEESEAMYARAGEPKKLVILPGLTHYDVYQGEGFTRVMREAVGWYNRFIPAS